MRKENININNQLVEAFRLEHESAFTVFFRELYPAMTLYAFKYTNQQSAAEEIAEEAFIKAWERRETFFHYKTLCSWLYTTIRNASIDWLRHQAVKTKAETAMGERYAETDSTALDHLVRAEVLRELGSALGRLPSQQQKIVRAFYLEEQSLQEIADHMRLSIHTVKSQKARGLAFLRKLMTVYLIFSHLGKFIENFVHPL